METINLKGTDDTPRVILDAANNVMEISGCSLPEDVNTFYKPILKWVGDYAQSPNPKTVFSFNMSYFNTASCKNIISLLQILKQMHNAGSKVEIEWAYREDDEEMEASGEEFSRIVKIPFRMIKLNE